MNLIVSISQMVVAIFLIILVLVQQGESGLGSAFGQEGGSYSTKRGLHKHIYKGTIFFGVLFIVFAILNILY
jgi:protein translocase SecG subunit